MKAVLKRWRHGALALFLGLSLGATTSAVSAQPTTYGDVDSGGTVTVADVVCAIVVSLWESGGMVPPAPACAATFPCGSDLDCNDTTTVADIQVLISLSLGASLPASVDANGDGVHDDCTGSSPCADVLDTCEVGSTDFCDGLCDAGDEVGSDDCDGVCDAILDQNTLQPVVHAFVRNLSSNNPNKVQVFRSGSADDRAVVEYDLSALGGTVVSAQLQLNRSNTLGNGAARTFEVFGYAGDGVLQNADGGAGSLVLGGVPYDMNDPSLTLDVTAHLDSLLGGGATFAGYSVRQTTALSGDAEFGTGTGAYPTLTVVTSTGASETGPDCNGLCEGHHPTVETAPDVHAFVRNLSSNNPNKVQVFRSSVDDRAVLEYDLTALASPVLAAELVFTRSNSLGNGPARLFDLHAFVGDGVLQNADGGAGALLQGSIPYDMNDATLTLDVSAQLTTWNTAGENFGGFNLRQQASASGDAEFGTGTGAYPVLRTTVGTGTPDTGSDCDGVCDAGDDPNGPDCP